jgi:hypothetical protein
MHENKEEAFSIAPCGEKDVSVAFAQSKTMYRRMFDGGKLVEFVDLPLADHYFGRQADREKLLGAIEGFLAKYNPADLAPSGTGANTDPADGAKQRAP